jgi:hypothetical protein
MENCLWIGIRILLQRVSLRQIIVTLEPLVAVAGTLRMPSAYPIVITALSENLTSIVSVGVKSKVLGDMEDKSDASVRENKSPAFATDDISRLKARKTGTCRSRL